MTYQVLTEIRVKTRQGETVLTQGSMIRLDPAKATPLIESRKIKPLEFLTSMTATRRETLLACMIATWETISRPYLKTGYKLTSEVKEAESVIEKLQYEVLEGKAKLEDFRNACSNWEKALRENANGT